VLFSTRQEYQQISKSPLDEKKIIATMPTNYVGNFAVQANNNPNKRSFEDEED
jgi:hypothetical protein